MASSPALDAVQFSSLGSQSGDVSRSTLINHDHLRNGGLLCVQTSTRALCKSSGLHAEGSISSSRLSSIAPLVPFRAPQYWSSGAQLQAYGLELQALVAHIVSQRADKGGFRLSTATSWSTRCANNIDLFSRRYSSRHMLFIASHRRVSTDYRTHAMAVITMNTRKLPSPIRLPTTIPSDSTNGWLISARAPYYPQAFATSQSAKTSSSSSTKLAPACDA